jgi:hypothetical protein
MVGPLNSLTNGYTLATLSSLICLLMRISRGACRNALIGQINNFLRHNTRRRNKKPAIFWLSAPVTMALFCGTSTARHLKPMGLHSEPIYAGFGGGGAYNNSHCTTITLISLTMHRHRPCLSTFRKFYDKLFDWTQCSGVICCSPGLAGIEIDIIFDTKSVLQLANFLYCFGLATLTKINVVLSTF